MEKRLKVLFIAKNIPRPGKTTNKIIYKIADHLSEFCDVSFLRPREIIPFWLRHNPKFADLYGLKGWKYKQYNITTYPYIHLPFKKANYWLLNKLFVSQRTTIENLEKFDLIHAHYLLPDGYIAQYLSRKFGVPYIITVRNQDIQYLEKISKKNPDYKKARKILKGAKRVLSTNLAYKNFFDKEFDIECVLLPHGIEENLFQYEDEKKRTDKIKITTVAEAITRKNIDWVIKAFSEYEGIKNIELNIIGNGPELERLKKIADGDKRIIFYGRIPRSQVIEILHHSDIFALPSINETFGLVYLEAAATRNAIIGFKREGVWGLFQENNEMLYCDSYESFKFLLINLINSNERIDMLATNALQRSKDFKWEVIISKYKTVYLA